MPDSLGFDKQFLAAPIKSAVDKYQLVPEFLKVCVCILCMHVCVNVVIVVWKIVGEGTGEATLGFV